MDNIFKFTYSVYAYQELGNLVRDWKDEVKNMNLVWDELENCFDKDLFLKLFEEHGLELNLPVKSYNHKVAFLKAKTEWRTELMLDIAEKIFHTYFDDIDYTISSFMQRRESTGIFFIDISRVISCITEPRKRQRIKQTLVHLNKYFNS